MYLIDQHAKKIMEECKERAKEAGLRFDSDTLEYIVTNRDMLELSPKVMIPTLYDYWVHDVEVLKEIGKYKISPANPYETVINSRPAISFYNDNNPDWLNIMIFYHVLAHIDFFQNNKMFERTWHDDFVGQALADKRLIAQLRIEQGRWVDYVLEFSRAINNLNGYFPELFHTNLTEEMQATSKLDFYLGDFLQTVARAPESDIYKEVARYNALLAENESIAENIFFSEIRTKYPEFQAKYTQYLQQVAQKPKPLDIMEFIRDNSPFLRKESNQWMKSVMSVVRNTAIYFEPQIRTKIINEGWASYWHDTLFRQDERIKGHEIEYARINAYVTSVSRAGLNPYAIGLRLVQHVEDLANQGKLTFHFQKIMDSEIRQNYDLRTDKGREAIFALRRNFSDFMLIKTFTSQDFVDEHDLFVLGQKIDQQRQVRQYYIKSRKAEDYQNMLIESLYHPPYITVDMEATNDENIRLIHHFEGKELIREFIGNTMLGIEFLWGGSVELDTMEMVSKNNGKPTYRKVRYFMEDKTVAQDESGLIECWKDFSNPIFFATFAKKITKLVNLLITGGAGFIGSHVVRLFVTQYPQYHIFNLDALTYAGNLRNLDDIKDAPNYTFLKGDITDAKFLEGVFTTHEIDAVIHLAAESHVDRSILDPLAFVQTNVIGTVNLLNTAKQYWKEKPFATESTRKGLFYHVSTDEVYGSLDNGGFFTEDTPYDPQSPYSASKAASDHFVRAYHNTYKLPIVVSNCSNNYGPNQFPEKLIPLFIQNIRQSKPLPVYGKGENIRDWLYVIDHARAIDVVFHKGTIGETYNIGGFNEWKNIDLIHLLCQIMDKKLGREAGESAKLISYVTDRAGHDLRYAIDSTKIKDTLGWSPSLIFEEGLEQTVEWYLENQNMVRYYYFWRISTILRNPIRPQVSPNA